MSRVTFSEDATYRLQNFAFETYVHYSNPSTAPVVQGLPYKDTPNQEWKFEKATADTYYIRSMTGPNVYLQANAGNSGHVLIGNRSTATSFEFIQSDGGSYLIRATSAAWYKYLICNNFHGYVQFENTTTWDSIKWNIISATSTPIHNNRLSQGTYRIRSFDKQHLLTASSSSDKNFVTSLIRKENEGEYQQWVVTPQKNGRYTVLNSKTRQYLGCPPGQFDRGRSVIAVNTEFEWELQSVGGFGWSFRVPEQKPAVSIGFADLEVSNAEEISLQATDATPSQFWYIERAVVIGRDKLHARRELEEGAYSIQSTEKATLVMEAQFGPRGVVLTPNSDAAFKLKYVSDTSPEFTLSSTRRPSAFIVAAGNALDLGTTPSRFVLLQAKDQASTYYICLASLSAEDTYRAVSGRTERNLDDMDVLTIENMVQGNRIHMWKFVPHQP